MKEIKFKIKGMNCKACAMVIADEVREMTGIEEAEVYFNTNSARVVYDEMVLDKEKIFRLIEELGDYKIENEE
jgi:copper chaperone CopZ